MKRLSFFKFFRFGRNDKQMQIPIAFMAIVKQLPEKVYLRDRFNNMWTVNISKIGDEFYFSDGLVKFVNDNVMRSGDILVFEYLSEGLFGFKLYGPSATEKHLVSPVMVKDGDGSGDEDDEMENEHSEYVFKRWLDNDDDNDNDDNDNDDEEETREDGNHVMMRHEKTKGKEVVMKKFHHVGRRKTMEGPLIKSKAKRYDMEIFKAGFPRPKNPYFVIKALQKRKTELFIPKNIIRENNIDMNQEIWLVDPRKRKFPGKCKKWKSGRMMISGGWRRLCKANFVKEDDICICELVQAPNRRLIIKITFIHSDGFKPIIRKVN